MIKISLVLGVTTAIASAWFMPTVSFGGSGDEKYENVDKSFVRNTKKEVVKDTKNSKMFYDSTPSKKMHFYAAWDFDFDLGRYSTTKYQNKYRVICIRDSK